MRCLKALLRAGDVQSDAIVVLGLLKPPTELIEASKSGEVKRAKRITTRWDNKVELPGCVAERQPFVEARVCKCSLFLVEVYFLW